MSVLIEWATNIKRTEMKREMDFKWVGKHSFKRDPNTLERVDIKVELRKKFKHETETVSNTVTILITLNDLGELTMSMNGTAWMSIQDIIELQDVLLEAKARIDLLKRMSD